MSVRTARPASAEIVEAVRWYETQRPGLGGEFFDAVTAILSLIESAPRRERRSRLTREPDALSSPDFRIRSCIESGQLRSLS